MTFLSTWRENYLQGVKSAEEEREVIYQKIVKKENKLSERKKQVERLEKDIKKLNDKCITGCNYPSWIDGLVIPIAEYFSKELGLSYEIYGPFGLRAQTSIYWKTEAEKSITDQKTYHLRLVPTDLKEGKLGYETGEYKAGVTEQQKTLSDLNGFNKEVLPLPETLDEIRLIIMKS